MSRLGKTRAKIGTKLTLSTARPALGGVHRPATPWITDGRRPRHRPRLCGCAGLPAVSSEMMRKRAPLVGS